MTTFNEAMMDLYETNEVLNTTYEELVKRVERIISDPNSDALDVAFAKAQIAHKNSFLVQAELPLGGESNDA